MANTRPMRLPLACALLLASQLAAAAAEVPVPPLRQRVTDLTGTLEPARQQQLEQTLAAFESRKGSQVAVLIVPTTAPDTIEGYSIRVAEAWKLGRKGVDDGALLLIARDDRTLRIEVGYGLEGALPDAIANRIIDETIVPAFKQGDFAGGIEAGVSRILSVIDGEPLPAPPPQASPANIGSSLDKVMMAMIAGSLILNVFLRSLKARLFGGLVGAGLIAGFAWAVTHVLVLALVFGFFTFLLIAFNRGSGRGGSSRGYSGGSYRSSGGGFSGGGGRFGGGGASGRW